MESSNELQHCGPFCFSLFAPSDLIVSNCLWFNAHLGIGLYLYSRQHMKNTSSYRRIMYSVFGAVMFNFGSVLFWATTKALLLKNEMIRSLFGLGSGLALLYIGREYLDFIDGQTQDLKELD